MEPSKELSGALLDGGPEAVALEALVIGEVRGQDVLLDLLARSRPTPGDEEHHLRVTVELEQQVHVGGPEPAEMLGLGEDERLGLAHQSASCSERIPAALRTVRRAVSALS